MKPALANHSRQPRSCIAILGVPFDNVTKEDAVELVEEMVSSQRPHYLATANVDFTVQALEDEELRRILFDAHLVLCDGTPLLWASRWLGNRLAERLAGSDLVPILLSLAARKKYRIYFLGDRAWVAERAVANIRREYPGLNVVGCDAPQDALLHEMDHEKISARIRAAKPDMLFVSFSSPKQEKWIAMNYRALGVPVCVGVGATLDFLAGEVTMIPQWARRCGLGWLFRLRQEPRHSFRDRVKDFWTFGRALRRQWQVMRPSKGGKTPATAPTVPTDIETSHLSLPERLDAAFVAESTRLWDAFGIMGRTLLVDASNVAFIDSTGVGALIRLRKILREKDAELVLVGPSAALLHGLEMMKLAKLFSSVPDWGQARFWRAQNVSVQSHDRGDRARLDWSGDVTAETVEDVWGRTAALLETRAHAEAEMAIDLNQVSFMDSAGLGFMVRVRRTARQRGVVVRFVNPSESVQRVVRLAKLEEFLLGDAA